MPKPPKQPKPGAPGSPELAAAQAAGTYTPPGQAASPPSRYDPGGLGPAPQAPDIKVTPNEQLTGVQDEYAKYVNDIQAGTGRVLDQATTHTRDLASGIKTGAREDAAFRGVGTEQAMRDIDDSTLRTVAGQHAAIAAERERMIGQGLEKRVGMEEREQGLNQGEKQIGLEGYNSYQNAMNMYNQANLANSNALFNQLQAVLEAKRSSTAPEGGYGGTGGPFYPQQAPPPVQPPRAGHAGFGGVRR